MAGVTTASVAASAASQNLASANVLTNSIQNLFASSNRYVRSAAYFGAFAVIGAILYFAYRYLTGGGGEQSLLDKIVKELNNIELSNGIDNKETAREKVLEKYKLGIDFNNFFKKGRKIEDIKIEEKSGVLTYIDEYNITSIINPGQEDEGGVKLREEISEKIHNKVRFLNIISGFIDNNAFFLGLLGVKFKIKPSELERMLTEHDTSLLKRYKDEIKFNEDVDSLEIKVVAFSNGSPTVRVRKVGEKAWSQCALNFKKIDNNTNIADYINFLNLLFKGAGEQNKWEYILKFNYGGPTENGIKLTLCKIEQKSGKIVKKAGLNDVFTKEKKLKDEDFVMVNRNRKGIFEKVFFKDDSPLLTELYDKVYEVYKELFNQEFYEKISNKIFIMSKSELMNIVAPPKDLELESKDIEDILSSVEGETIKIKINKVDITGKLNLYLLDKDNKFIASVNTLYATSDKSKIEEFVKSLSRERCEEKVVDVKQKDETQFN